MMVARSHKLPGVGSRTAAGGGDRGIAAKIPRASGPVADIGQILAAVCVVMEVSAADMPGKSTPRTKPRLQWARNMAAYVMHDFGLPDGTVAAVFGRIHRITILVRRRRMAEKLETTQRYRDHHAAILARLATARCREAQDGGGPPRASQQR